MGERRVLKRTCHSEIQHTRMTLEGSRETEDHFGMCRCIAETARGGSKIHLSKLEILLHTITPPKVPEGTEEQTPGSRVDLGPELP